MTNSKSGLDGPGDAPELLTAEMAGHCYRLVFAHRDGTESCQRLLNALLAVNASRAAVVPASSAEPTWWEWVWPDGRKEARPYPATADYGEAQPTSRPLYTSPNPPQRPAVLDLRELASDCLKVLAASPAGAANRGEGGGA